MNKGAAYGCVHTMMSTGCGLWMMSIEVGEPSCSDCSFISSSNGPGSAHPAIAASKFLILHEFNCQLSFFSRMLGGPLSTYWCEMSSLQFRVNLLLMHGQSPHIC